MDGTTAPDPSALLDAAPGGVITIDAGGRCTYTNRAADELLGYVHGELIGLPIHETVHHSRADGTPIPRSECMTLTSIATGEPHASLRYMLWRKDGSPVWVEYAVNPVDGGRGGAVITMLDATKRRAAEQRLTAQEAAARALASAESLADATPRLLREIAEHGEWDLGEVWRVEGDEMRCVDLWARAGVSNVEPFVEASERLRLRYGQGLPGRIWASGRAEWIPDLDLDGNFPRRDAARIVGLRSGVGLPIVRRGEVLGSIDLFSRTRRPTDEPWIEALGAISLQLAQFIDRTEAIARRRDSEARVRAIVDSSIDAVIGMDERGVITAWNPQAVATFGWSAREAIGRSVEELIVPERYRERHHRGRERFLTDGTRRVLDQRVELEALHRDGHEIPVELSITATRVGRSWSFNAFARDITDRRRSAARLQLLAETGAALSTSLDPDRTLQTGADLAVPFVADYCYVALLAAGGTLRRLAIAHVDPEQAARARVRHRGYPIDPAGPHPVNEVLRSRAAVRHPVDDAGLRALARSPEHLEDIRAIGFHDWLGVPLVARGEVLGAFVFMTTAASRRTFSDEDVSFAQELARRTALALDNARLFEEVQEALRTRDAFLTAASHDLKTPLAAIKGFVQLLRRRVDRSDDERMRRLVEPLAHVDAATTKMTSLINELLDIARLQMGRPVELDLADVDLVALAHQSVEELGRPGDVARVRIESAQASIVGRWDALRIERVLTNLLSNAVKYSPRTTEIVLALEQDAEDAVISVRDRGVGIHADDLPRIFERFHRGRNVGGIEGTGIGLANARFIVELHGGRIAVHSVEGRGTTFTVRLPLAGPVTRPEVTQALSS